jgi:pSer/pThr/pTyr-binding forkhead associated (FHA) protein
MSRPLDSGDGAEVCIPAARISRRHARVIVRDGRAWIEDLGSKNGTSLRGRPVRSAVELANRDVITIGATVLVVRVADADSPTETVTGRA